jgi:hypothetical protein
VNGTVATGFYNASFVLLFAHALLPLPPLVWAADQARRAGDAFQAAQERADQTRRNP